MKLEITRDSGRKRGRGGRRYGVTDGKWMARGGGGKRVALHPPILSSVRGEGVEERGSLCSLSASNFHYHTFWETFRRPMNEYAGYMVFTRRWIARDNRATVNPKKKSKLVKNFEKLLFK